MCKHTETRAKKKEKTVNLKSNKKLLAIIFSKISINVLNEKFIVIEIVNENTLKIYCYFSVP